MSDTPGRSDWWLAQESLRWSGERWVPAGRVRVPAGPYGNNRRDHAWGIEIALFVALLATVLGAASLVYAAVGHWPHVTVYKTRAVVTEPLSALDCNRGHPLLISIAWHGRSVRTEDDGPACSGDYFTGQSLTVYVGSDSPADVGPDANWILNPDTHDPFDFLGGPNEIRGSLSFFGVVLLIGGLGGGLVVTIFARRSHKEAPRGRTRSTPP